MQENTATTTAPTASTPAAPRTDRLELVKELGRGSIGVVHKARNPQVDRLAALRQFQVPQWLDDVNDLLKKILAEARAASALSHPNVARLFTCGYKDFNVFMTFEFVEGQTLREIMAARTPDFNEVLSWARQLCAALDYAHDNGVYHQFLNPSNVKIAADGSLKLLDFGLLHDKHLLSQTPAKRLENEPYLSPEEIKNRVPDRAANIFSLGTLLYEMYTTRSPFAGKHLGEVDRSITDVMPYPLNVANGRVPEAISRVVLKALAKNPGERYQNCQQLFEALEAANREPRVVSAGSVSPATGQFPAASATGSFRPPTAAIKPPTAAIKPPTAAVKPPSGPATTKVRVPSPPATASRKPAKAPVNQWMLAGIVVAGLVVIAALAMMFQRKPADLSDAAAPQVKTPRAAAAPASSQAPAPFSDSAQPANERVTRGEGPARSARQARVPQMFTEPAPGAAANGQITVSALPLGSIIEIEGRSGQWRSPQTIGPLPPGNYKVVVSKPGYATESRSVQVSAGGRSQIDIRLTATKGFLTVSGTPSGASIVVDGRDSGRVTPAELVLDPGAHAVSVRRAGYLESGTTIKVAAGQSTSYSPGLMAAGRTDNIKILSGKFFGGGVSQGMARIEIKSEPKGAQVLVNGTPLQKTTPVDIQVEAGNYDITLQKEGYRPVHESAIVGMDDRVKIEKTLMR